MVEEANSNKNQEQRVQLKVDVFLFFLQSLLRKLMWVSDAFPVRHLPDVAGMAANQLNNFARVADGAVGEQEE